MLEFPELISWGHIRNRSMHPHRNHGLELVLVEYGHLEWQVETRAESLYPGSLFFTLPWQVHGSRMIREPDNRIYYILIAQPETAPAETSTLRLPETLNFTPEETGLIGEALFRTPLHTRSSSPLIRSLFTELIQKLDAGHQDERPLCAALLKALLLETARIFSSPEKPDRSKWTAEQNVSKFMLQLQTHIDEPWTLDRMAEACKVKRSRFADIARQLTGYPPVKYLNRLRFETAGRLLKESRKTVTEIAFECGFSSSQYFAAQFKKESGMTPTEYRRFAPELESILSANWKSPEDRTLEEERSRRLALN